MDEQLQLLLKVCSGELKDEEKEEYGITDEMLSGIQQACNIGYSAAQYKGLEEKIDNLTAMVTTLSEKLDVILLSGVSSSSSTPIQEQTVKGDPSIEKGNYSQYI